MRTTPPLKGIIAYPITPFDPETGAVDHNALRRLTDRLVTTGSHAVAPLGSAGESAYLGEA